MLIKPRSHLQKQTKFTQIVIGMRLSGDPKKISLLRISTVHFTDYHECCYLPDDYKFTYDPRFKDTITFEVFCQQRAPSHLQQEQLDLKEMKTAFDKNMKKVCLTKTEYKRSIRYFVARFLAVVFETDYEQSLNG